MLCKELMKSHQLPGALYNHTHSPMLHNKQCFSSPTQELCGKNPENISLTSMRLKSQGPGHKKNLSCSAYLSDLKGK